MSKIGYSSEKSEYLLGLSSYQFRPLRKLLLSVQYVCGSLTMTIYFSTSKTGVLAELPMIRGAARVLTADTAL